MKKVLIVDDNVDLAESLKEGLEHEGHDVATTTSAEQAIELCRSTDYDLTLMDVRLPGIDGIGGLIEILTLKPGSRIAVMSGYNVGTLLDEATRRGAVSVLQKPFEVEQVLTLLAEQ